MCCGLLEKGSRKYFLLQWSGNLYKFSCLCFDLGHVPQVWSNLLKIPVAHLHRRNKRKIIYLDNLFRLVLVTTSGLCNQPEDAYFDKSVGA